MYFLTFVILPLCVKWLILTYLISRVCYINNYLQLIATINNYELIPECRNQS